jgi:hypothetical protein
MNSVDEKLRGYLRELFGPGESVVQDWALSKQLPYFLQDAYAFRRGAIHGKQFLLALARRDHKPPARELRVQLERIAALAKLPVAYVVETLTSRERRRLVEQRIPFVVPGNQLYLPMLGIDFREYFRQPRPARDEPLSPATQAILLAALTSTPRLDEMAPERCAAKLGYGAMTLSRAVRQLVAADLATVAPHGRQRWLKFEKPPATVWEEAQRVLRSPVKRTLWVAPDAVPLAVLDPPLAGESALARHTLLIEPECPVYAVNATAWTPLSRRGIAVLGEPEPGAVALQIWSYDPRLGQAGQAVVDPLSLVLSFRDATDERIRIALDELGAHLPWSVD